MPARGRPKKCARKLNFQKDDNQPNESAVGNKQEILQPVIENQNLASDVIASPILPESSIEPVASTSGSNINNDIVPVTNDIVDRKFPVKLENHAQVCFFNSICQIFYSMPKFLAKLKYTPKTNNVVTSMQDILERMKICDEVIPYPYIHRIALNNYVFGTQQDAQEALCHILDNMYPDNNIDTSSPFSVTLNETIYCSDVICEKSINKSPINKKEPHQTLPIELVETEQLSVHGLLNEKLEAHHCLEGYRCNNNNVFLTWKKYTLASQQHGVRY